MGTASQAQAQAQVYQRVFGSKDVISSSLAEVTLMNDATGVEYFLECYLRLETLVGIRHLVVSYAGHVISGLIGGNASERTAELYNAAIEGKVPESFWYAFADRFSSSEDETLSLCIIPLIRQLGKAFTLENQKPLDFLSHLLSIKAIAAALVKSEDWLPLAKLTTGRSIEYESLLGPFFTVSVLPDIFHGNVMKEYMGGTQQQVAVGIKTLRMSQEIVLKQLNKIVLQLLKMGGEVREKTLQWIAFAIESNSGRSKMRINMLKCATHGFFLNLSSVMLHLCAPFMDPGKGYGKAWEKIDINYLFSKEEEGGGSRLSSAFKEDTRCAASLEELSGWLSKESGRLGEGERKYHFICDCFFMTSKVLHLGFMKSVRDFLENMKELGRHQQTMRRLEMTRHVWSNGPYRQRTEQQLEQLNTWMTEHKEIHLCYECAIQEEGLLHQALQYYKLMGCWLLNFVIPKESRGGEGAGTQFLLTDEFRMLPEFFVDDVTELLSFTAKIAERQPRVLQDEELESFMDFLVVFMGCPDHVHNPYLRAKMVDVLHLWVPPPQIQHPLVSKMSNLFEFNLLAKEFLVSHLLRLYVDIEFTGSNTQFYDKFNIRHHIGEMLEYLWSIPVHKESWKKLSNAEADRFYLKFLNMLVNDAIYLLDEGMKRLPEVRQTLEAMENAEVWNNQPPQEQQERESALRQNEDALRHDLLLANVHINLMEYTTVDITRAFLLPEMVERIATMLNYFLRFLVGPERKKLKVRNPEKYGWDPRKMLSQIIRIYLHLARADKDASGSFVTAVTRDGRSYSNELFLEAQSIGDRFRLVSVEELDFFAEFIEKLQSQVEVDEKEDEMLGEIPDEFLDPIQYTLMRDPVTLPSSKVTVDRATIQRHLLSDQTDPFNRSKLEIKDLIPDLELKEKIKSWIRDQKK